MPKELRLERVSKQCWYIVLEGIYEVDCCSFVDAVSWIGDLVSEQVNGLVLLSSQQVYDCFWSNFLSKLNNGPIKQMP